MTAFEIAADGAERIEALIAESDPDRIRTVGERLLAEDDETLRGIGLALTATGKLRRLTLTSTLFQARHLAGTDDLAGGLTTADDALWVAVGETLRNLRAAWIAAGGN